MKRSKKMRWLIPVLALGIGCGIGSVGGVVAAAPSPKDSAEWRKKMQEFRSTLQSLLMNLHVDSRFESASGKRELKRDTKKLLDLSHSIAKTSQGSTSPDQDPLLKYLSGSLEDDVKRAYQELERGNNGYARGLLSSITQYCITCHTRSEKESQFHSGAQPAGLKKLPAYERADYFAAIREFDQALAEYHQVISDARLAQSHPIQWDRTVLKALSILVRVKRDPIQTETLLKKVLATAAAPAFLKEDAARWLESVEAWRKEPKRDATTEKGHLFEGKRLMKAAQEKQRFPVDRAAEVLYLRASAELHDVLRTSSEPTEVAEALYLIGVCYESVKVPDLWTLHEFYYESCVRKAPHTPIARECYGRYQASIFAGYSGSGGTHIPPEVRKKLRELDQASK